MVEGEERNLVIHHTETVHAVVFPKHLEFSECVNHWITTGAKQYQIYLFQEKKKPFHVSHKTAPQEIPQFHNSFIICAHAYTAKNLGSDKKKKKGQKTSYHYCFLSFILKSDKMLAI